MRHVLLLAVLCVSSVALGDDDDRRSNRSRRWSGSWRQNAPPNIPPNVYWKTWTEGNRTHYYWSTSPIPDGVPACSCQPSVITPAPVVTARRAVTFPPTLPVDKPDPPLPAPVPPVEPAAPEPIAQPVESVPEPALTEQLTPEVKEKPIPASPAKPKRRPGFDFRLSPPMIPALETLADPQPSK